MSDFLVPVKRVTEIKEHPNADALEIVVIEGYESICQKGIHTVGDLIIYIPTDSILPEWLSERMGLQGKLAGSKKNRVKPIRLRGIYSEGLCCPLETVPEKGISNAIEIPAIGWDGELHHHVVHEEQDVAELLGITKYEPPVPPSLNGVAAGGNKRMTLMYDFNAIESKMNLFEEGEEVVATEKIHGTCCIIGLSPEDLREQYGEKLYKGYGIATSKGLSKKGIFLNSAEDGDNIGNTYVKAGIDNGLFEKVAEIAKRINADPENPVFIIGEIFGPGIQDLHYSDKIEFRAFDICEGGHHKEKYVDYNTFKQLCEDLDIPVVPELYVGPYNYEKIKELSFGTTTFGKDHIREGVVIKSLSPDKRKVAKRVSEDYKLRKGGTEFN